MSICFGRFFFSYAVFLGVHFIMNDLVYCIDWNIVTLNCRSVIMTFLFDWVSLIFIISSLFILYSDDYMFGALNIFRFILLVLKSVVSITFEIVSPVGCIRRTSQCQHWLLIIIDH